jgi:hypothetical protein
MSAFGEWFFAGRRVVRTVALMSFGLSALMLVPAQAEAQLSRVGNSQGVVSTRDGVVRGNDAAYDPKHGIYLIVGAYGSVNASFTDANGAIVGAPSFPIGNPSFAHYPRAEYSPDVNGGQGGFLVTWHQNDGQPNVVHAAIVAYPNGVISGDQAISDGSGGGTVWEAAPAIAYSETSHKFLVVWNNFSRQIQGRFVDVNGAPSGQIMTIETGDSRDPSVAWNPATDEFGVSASAWAGGTQPGAFVGFRRVAASSGAMSSRVTWGYTAGTFITDATINTATNHFVVASAGYGVTNYAELDQNGALLATGLLNVGAYDGLAVAYNEASGSILAVGMGNSYDIVGSELNGQGVPISQPAVLTNGGGTSGSFYPRVTERAKVNQWNISYSRQFTSVADQIIATDTSLGGPVSNVQVTIDSPINGAILGPNDTLTISGWAVDRGAQAGSGIDRIDIWAQPTSGGAVFLGGATSFAPRSDLSGTLGSQFLNSGFSVSTNGLPDGTYTITAYPHSTVLNDFAWGHAKSVTVRKASSLPLMSVDSPVTGASITGVVTVTGWAIDRFSSSGTGIDAVHVWAYPAGGGNALFLGAGALGINRPDIGGAFGNNRFAPSGFTVTGLLPSGTYNLVTFARDVATHGFNVWQTRTVTVHAQFVLIDSPAGGNVNLGSTISGWAVDIGASNGTGIDLVDIWARDVSSGVNTFVGRATGPLSRPDVASLFGRSQFTLSGYTATLQNLTPGHNYDLFVFAHSMVTNEWSPAIVRIHVN